MTRMNTARKISRRRFLGHTAASAGSLLILPSARTARAYDANARLRLAVFGRMYNAQHFLTAAHIYNGEISAFCNPDQRIVPEILQKWEETAKKLESDNKPEFRRAAGHYRRLSQREGLKIFSDVRELFGVMADQIDAFVVSDYDHFHGVTCGEAMRAGKPVCSERPLGLGIDDARNLRSLAAAKKVPTTYRSPGTGTGPFRRAMELLEDGVIGPVKEVHFWFKRGGPDRDALPRGKQPVPAGLNWDLWLGPLAWREYHPDWMAYSHWRQTSNGGLGVFGAHTMIFPFMALKMRELWDRPGSSIRVTAECSQVNLISYPRWERVRWEIPARQNMPPVEITWHHGPDFAPDSRQLLRDKTQQFGISSAEEADAILKDAGSLVIGSEGALAGDDHSVRITALPKTRLEKMELNRPQRIPESQGIYGDWIAACRGGKPHILANFDNGGCLSELLMLGNIATQFPGETLAYDPLAGKITNHPDAGQKLGFTYRDGWRI